MASGGVGCSMAPIPSLQYPSPTDLPLVRAKGCCGMNSGEMWYCVALYSEIYGVGGSERTAGEIDSEKAAASTSTLSQLSEHQSSSARKRFAAARYCSASEIERAVEEDFIDIYCTSSRIRGDRDAPSCLVPASPHMVPFYVPGNLHCQVLEAIRLQPGTFDHLSSLGELYCFFIHHFRYSMSGNPFRAYVKSFPGSLGCLHSGVHLQHHPDYARVLQPGIVGQEETGKCQNGVDGMFE